MGLIEKLKPACKLQLRSPIAATRPPRYSGRIQRGLEVSTASISAVADAPEVGQMVSVRSRSWTVTDVQKSVLLSQRLAALQAGQSLLTLSSIEDDGLGEELQVIWELEPGARIIERVALPEPLGATASALPMC